MGPPGICTYLYDICERNPGDLTTLISIDVQVRSKSLKRLLANAFGAFWTLDIDRFRSLKTEGFLFIFMRFSLESMDIEISSLRVYE